MANVLEKIVLDKKQELVQKKQALPLESFKDKLLPNEKSFFNALSKDGISYIFECKKASPSKGLIRDNFNLDEIIEAYEKEAACFSVLTDEKYFQGKFEYLKYVQSKVKQPCLNKDFFVDTYQVYLARHLGASAILLMLSVLSDEEYLIMSDLAHSYNMDVLTEVSTEEETARALTLGAKIIGINNRDLRDLSTDLATTERLVPLIKAFPDFDGVIISESGIYTKQDINRLADLVDGFLVGSALMAKQDLGSAVNDLVYSKIKVCGVTSISQAEVISKFPVSYMGLIFAPNSKRFVSLETASEIVSKVKHNYVGVFVDYPLEQVADYAHTLSLKAVQLHGHESVEYIRKIRALLPSNCEVFKAVAIDINDTNKLKLSDKLLHLQEVIDDKTIDKILLDCKVNNEIGGTGKSFDWQILSDQDSLSNIVLAGGIGIDNINEAKQFDVALIDVNSGVEDSPGNKSEQKLISFFHHLRG